MMVLNTCTVTAAAASDSRQKVRQANKAGIQRIVVTGCLSTIKPESVSEMPGVIQLVPNSEKDRLVPIVLDLPAENLGRAEYPASPSPAAGMRTRAFLKVQDGCDNRCTFCITTVARGEGTQLSHPAGNCRCPRRPARRGKRDCADRCASWLLGITIWNSRSTSPI